MRSAAVVSTRAPLAAHKLVVCAALETLLLNAVGLDSSNAAALGALMSCNTRLHGISLEGNSLTEAGLLRLPNMGAPSLYGRTSWQVRIAFLIWQAGLLRLADALRGHPTIGEFSVANREASEPEHLAAPAAG